MAETQKHNMRIPDELWEPAKDKGRRLQIPVTTVVKRALAEFAAEDDETSLTRHAADAGNDD